jgi:hypothetical protein
MMPLGTEFLFRLTGTIAAPLEIGVTPAGTRRVVPITEGKFEGPRLRGTLIPGGTDHMLVRPDGVLLPDVRVTLVTDDGDLILMTYGGFRYGPPEVMHRLERREPVEASEYYFRIAPRFETGSDKYGWLNRILAVGTGHRLPAGPIYDVYEIL